MQPAVQIRRGARRVSASCLFMRAIWGLLGYDLTMKFFGFRAVYRAVSRRTVSGSAIPDPALEQRICDAVDRASSFYWKRVFCLQRSAVTTRMLKRYGIQAQLVIGCRSLPFIGHAWTEVDGRPVNDSRVYRERLCILDRV